MALEQKYLNVVTRAEGYMDILMYTPDNIPIASVSSNDVLSYSNINSIKDIKNYTTTTIATLEENLWLLNGQFVNPTEGRTYNGYVSNSMSDDNGDFTTNPKIDVVLSSLSDIENFSITLNPSVKSGYPKQIAVTYYDGSDNVMTTITKTIANETSLPNVTFETNLSSVAKLQIEFIGTQFKHRRIRVASIMFGKVLTLNQDNLLASDYLDKCSYVCDSIPSRTFSFDMNNYDRQYDIDNPENTTIDLDRQTRVLIRNGYNIYGYNEPTGNETQGYIQNPDRITEIEWDDWKELRLLNIYTNNDNTVTFECGSILDMMTDVFTQERFINNRTVRYIINEQLLPFIGLSEGVVIFSSDDNGVSYGDYVINTPLPELPVRELIQLLAFSVGATLLIKDDGTIKFANLDITKKSSFTNQHSFTYDNFVSIPMASQLENTMKISLPKYNATIDDSEGVQEIQKVTVSTIDTEIKYAECQPISAIVAEDDTSGGSVQSSTLYCRRGQLHMNMPDNTEVIIRGYPIVVTQSQDRTITADTLIIDTQLMKEDTNNYIKNKYRLWYGKKFKYSMQTRGEPLVDAGDYTTIETPFSSAQLPLNGYVLQNHITFDGTWSGDMEVIAL